ncbi:hypothetical protein [Cupriavidus pauculus]|uniref:hypothetical protein n=1 Tax=Cupriavidus pauculus TaxID=82633 RepID=UPI001D0CCD34|nr:hypothetical protein [Cupriavidus pauculus]
MPAHKSEGVTQAVALITSGQCKTAYAAAKRMNVAASSIHRDPAYKKWKAAQPPKHLK